MSSGFPGPEGYGPDPFGEFFARFFGGGPRPAPRHIDIGRLMSEPARQLVSAAASYAAEHGSSDLDTEHLLRAALTTEPTRTMIARAGADADALAAGDRPGGRRRAAPQVDRRQPRRQAGAAGRPRHRPYARRLLHRQRARADRAGRQPGLHRRADPQRRPLRPAFGLVRRRPPLRPPGPAGHAGHPPRASAPRARRAAARRASRARRPPPSTSTAAT